MIPAQLSISETIIIKSPEHLAEVVAQAAEVSQPLLPIGGGTSLATGNAVDTAYHALDLTGLSGIDDYIPTDMTASFRAGTSIREVREVLAANGQELPIDLSAHDNGTIGGLVATGFSGPRRLGQGTLKDLLIGCEYVRGDGLLAKAGGMTVKNVSGFEISRLLHGSWGALAVLTRVNLKVLPQPRGDRTLMWIDRDIASGLQRQQSLLSAMPMTVATQTIWNSEGISTQIRFLGRQSAIDEYVSRASSISGEYGEERLGAADWVPCQPTEARPQLVCSAAIDAVIDAATRLGQLRGMAEIRVSLGTGTLWASIDPEMISFQALADHAVGLWTIEGGSASWKNGQSVWGGHRSGMAVSQSIKNQFDPAGILNRKRLFV